MKTVAIVLQPSDDLASGHEFAAFPAQVARLEFP